jgi:hypothetical protein
MKSIPNTKTIRTTKGNMEKSTYDISGFLVQYAKKNGMVAILTVQSFSPT